MIQLSVSFIVVAALLPLSAHAKLNDWSKPCFDGKCAYDSPEGLGSLRIWGEPSAIADITKVGGWTILNCAENAIAQDIRLVCTGAQEECDSLWRDTGAAGKLVRLPESCGANAFARISRNWVHKDQTLPAELARSLRKRDGSVPAVQGLALDTNFEAIDPATNGEVNMEIQGANIPGAVGDAVVTNPATPSKRGLFGFIKDAFKKFNSFDKELTKDLPPIDVDKTLNLLDEKLSCPAQGAIPAFEVALKADAIAKGHAVVSVGVAAKGKIVPPKFDEFGVFTGFDADLKGTLRLVGSASGTADTGKITLLEAGIPGLDFPGILTLGPSLKITAQATAELDVNMDVDVTLAYKVEDAKLFFPPIQDSEKSVGNFNPAESPLKLSVAGSVASKAKMEAHLVPTLVLGINALGGIASANVFVDLDAKGSVNLNLNAGAGAAIDGTKSAGVDGCVDVGTGLAVQAGADASFFGLFDTNTKVDLFKKDFELFKKCFAAGDKPAPASLVNTSRSVLSAPKLRLVRRSSHLSKKRAILNLTCPGAVASLVSVVDQAVTAV